MKNIKRVHAGLLLTGLMLMMAACGDANRNQPVTTTTNKGTSTAPPAAQVEDRDNALVRVIHAIPGGATVDVFAENNKAFSNLSYKTTTPYQELSGERMTFRLRPAGMDTAQPLAENSEGLDDGDHYTVVALPGEGANAAALRILEDDLKAPSSGKARVRVIHASPDAGEIDVYVQGRDDKLFDGINFQSEAGYSDIDPVSGTLIVRPEGRSETLLTIPNVNLAAGKIYTVVVTGRARGGKLEVITVEDQVGGAPAR